MAVIKKKSQKINAALASSWKLGSEECVVSVRNLEAILTHLPLFLSGWPILGQGAVWGDSHDINIIENSDGSFILQLTGMGGNAVTFDGALSASEGFVRLLINVYIRRQPDIICLNAATAMFDDGLVVLVSDSSLDETLIPLHLASSGHRFFGDNLIAVRWEKEGLPVGRCLGLLPRMSLPLPLDCGAGFRNYIEELSEFQNEEIAYLRLGDRDAANFGEEAPIISLISMHKKEIGNPKLKEVSKPYLSNLKLVPLMDRLALSVPCFELQFSNSRDAAKVIIQNFR